MKIFTAKIQKAGQFNMNRPAPIKFFSSILCKILTGFKLYDIFTLDFDLFACLRIPALTRLSINLTEAAKAN